MPKRKAPNGQGSKPRLRKDGLWEIKITVGRDPGSGKLIRKSIYDKTQAGVRKKATAYAHEIDQGIYTEPSKITVGKWLDTWHKEYSRVKPSTADRYESDIRNHIKPSLGATKLSALTAPMIQSMYNQMHAERLADPKAGLSAKSIKNIHGVLHKALDQAVRLGYIKANPCDVCTLPEAGAKKRFEPLTQEQIQNFLQAIKGSKYEKLYTVVLFTGMRHGEALGLQWSRVDLDKGTLIVDKQLQKGHRKGGQYQLVDTKTSNYRKITLAPHIVKLLREVRREQAERRLLLGEAWKNDMNLVFTHEDGAHLTQYAVWACFKRIVKKAGIPETRVHDLRHMFASLALQNGDDLKTVSEALGHSDISTTVNIYAHVTEQLKKESAARMEAYIQSVK